MAVAVDATGSARVAGSVATISYTGITVGAALSNGALVAGIETSSAVTAMSAVWDNGGTNQSMVLVGSQVINNASSGTIYLFALRNPTAGNKTLKFAWTTSAIATCFAISFTGVEQSSDANAFKNFASTASQSTTQSTTVTSATGDMVVAMTAASTVNSINNTQIYKDTTSSGNDSAASRAAGAATVTISASVSIGFDGAICGFDVAAAALGAGPVAAIYQVPQAIKRASYW